MNHPHRMRRLPLTLAIAAVLSGMTPLAAAQSVEDYLQRAEAAIAARADDTAIIALKNALQADPGSLDARWRLAQAYLRKGNGAEAEKELQRAQAIGAEPVALTLALGEALLLQGAHQRVLDEITLDRVEQPVDRAVVLRQRGDALLILGRAGAGCEAYAEAETLAPDHAPIYRGLAQCALLDNDQQAAFKLLNQGLVVDDQDARTWIALGNLRRATGEQQGAIDAYTKAFEQDTNRVDALFHRAQIALQQAETDAAQADLALMRKHDPSYFGADVIAAKLAHDAGDRRGAREALERVLGRNPSYLPALFALAQINQEEGQHEQAGDLLRAYLSARPNDLDASLALAFSYLALDLPDRALALLLPMLEQGGAPDPRLSRLTGETYARLGDQEAAVPLLAAAAEAAPEDVELLTRLGMTRLAIGDTTGESDLEAARTQPGQDPRAAIALTYRYLELKEYDKALETLADVEAKLPDRAGPHHLRGRAFLGKGDLARARESFEQALDIDPNLMPVVIQLAGMDLAAGDAMAAKAHYERVLEREPSSVAAMVGIAEIERDQGNTAAWLDGLRRAAAADRTALAPRLLLARHYATSGDLSSALTLAREATAARANSAEAWALLGDIQMETGLTRDARTSYERLVALAPTAADAQYRLAGAELAMGNDTAARRALRAALDAAPNQVTLLQALYQLERRTGDAAEVERIASQLAALGIDAESGGVAGDKLRIAISGATGTPEQVKEAIAKVEPSLVAIKQHQQALGSDAQAADQALLDWLAGQPEERLARAYLAQSHLRRGQDTAAIEQYETLRRLAPEDPSVMNNLAVLYQRRNDPRAADLARAAHRLAPDNPDFADTLGWLLVAGGNSVEGLPLLQQAARGAPENVDIRLNLAEALLLNGDHDGAAAELERVTQIRREGPQADRVQALQRQLKQAAGGPTR